MKFILQLSNIKLIVLRVLTKARENDTFGLILFYVLVMFWVSDYTKTG